MDIFSGMNIDSTISESNINQNLTDNAENIKFLKFGTMVVDIEEAINKERVISSIFGVSLASSTPRLIFEESILNKSLLLVFEKYDKINKYAQIIMQNTKVYASDWNSKYDVKSLEDCTTRLNAAKEFIKYCNDKRLSAQNSLINYNDEYRFIFWSLMILAVDKTDFEEKLSLICDFARLLKITDEEVEDIVQVIRIVFRELDADDANFKTEIIQKIFKKVIKIYN